MNSDAADPSEAHLREHFVTRETRLEGGYLTVLRDHVRLPDGSTATREYVRHPGAVAVLPILDDGRVVLVRQYRYPVARILLELPAGKLDEGEPVLACAMRELREETGYTARQWARAGVFHNAAAYSTEGIEIWFARGLVAGPPATRYVGEFVEPVCTLTEAEFDALALASVRSARHEDHDRPAVAATLAQRVCGPSTGCQLQLEAGAVADNRPHEGPEPALRQRSRLRRLVRLRGRFPGDQNGRGLVECPMCADRVVSSACRRAPRLNLSGARDPEHRQQCCTSRS